MASTNVPQPSFTPTGFIAPSEAAILLGVEADMQSAFGGALVFSTQSGSIINPTPQGQWASSLSALVGNVYDDFVYITQQTDPSYAEGRNQDAIGRIYMMERIAASPTNLTCLCIGSGATVPVGGLIVDPSGTLYASLSSGTFGASGSLTITFQQLFTGGTALPSAVPTSVSIYQTIPGWDTVTVVTGTVGSVVESRTAFENRRKASVAQNSLGMLPSVLGAVLNVPGVTQAYVTENPSGTASIVGGVTLNANSLYVCVAAGTATPLSIATAIWQTKAPGCNYTGNTTVQVQDTSVGYSSPFPTYNVTYEIPNPLPLLVSVTMNPNPQTPANAATQIQNAIIGAVAGTDGGPPVTIGSTTYATRFVPAIASLGTWADGQIQLIQLGSNNNPDAAVVTGSCSGTALSITGLTSGTVAIGQTLSISNGTALTISPGTTITGFTTGTLGGTGQYAISQSQNFSTTTFGLATADQNFLQVNINQLPTISAANIAVSFP